MLQFPNSWDRNSLLRQIAFYAGKILEAQRQIDDKMEDKPGWIPTQYHNLLSGVSGKLLGLYCALIGLLREMRANGDEQAAVYADLLLNSHPTLQRYSVMVEGLINREYGETFANGSSRIFDLIKTVIGPLNVNTPARCRFFSVESYRPEQQASIRTKQLHDSINEMLNALPRAAKECAFTAPAQAAEHIPGQ